MIPKAFFVLACLLAGCADRTPEEPVDFGAQFVAALIVDAQKKCAAAGLPDLLDCADQRTPGDARTAARTATSTYATFQGGCYEAAGRGKCEEFMEMAYAQASAARPSRPESAPVPWPDQSAGP